MINQNLLLTGDDGYNLTKSLRFRSSASAYLSKTYSVSPTNNKIFTASIWLKRGKLGATQTVFTGYDGSSSNASRLEFLSGDTLNWQFGGSSANNLTTSQVFRDPSAWYHIVVSVDTTQATASNRQKLYINGTQVTAFSTANYPSQNAASQIMYPNGDNAIAYGAGAYIDGYMAEVNFIDGQALTPSSFGSINALTGVWQPAKYTGTYGTNGFYLPFTDVATTSGSNAGLGKDFSGNGNYWNTNNISVTAGTTYDSMNDVPTLTSATTANYCVLNPLDKGTSGTASNGNLNWAYSSGAWSGIRSTFVIPKTGQWYWEVTALGTYCDIGIYTSASNLNSSGYNDAYCYSYGSGNAAIRYGGVDQATVATYTTNDVISYYVNAGEVKVYKNNSLIGTWSQNLSAYSGDYFAGAFAYSNANGVAANFGQQPFVYTPPTGAVALNTYNLPTSTIVKGNTVMDATLYTGNSGTQSIVNTAGFKPDFVWLKSRSNALNHNLFDSVRGVQNVLASNSTGGNNYAGTGELTAFNSNGFTLVNSGTYQTNQSGYTYVGWQWQAGQGTTSSNTNGSITSTVSVNASAGFSVVTYTGTGANATVGHGLGIAPSVIIIKARNTSPKSWMVGLSSLNNWNNLLQLNTTDASVTDSTVFNGTAPTSTVFSVGTNSQSGANGTTYVAYCWSEIAGFSKFGSYIGNGSSDGPFVYTGFRPKFIMVKNSSAAGNGWIMYDTTRNTYNIVNYSLFANDSSTENGNSLSTENYYDLLSNGFKARTSNAVTNQNGSTLIYMAFAESPFKVSLAR